MELVTITAGEATDMTPEEMRFALAELGWSWSDLADKLGANRSVVQRWRHVPPAVARWLEECRQVNRMMPPAPQCWRRLS